MAKCRATTNSPRKTQKLVNSKEKTAKQPRNKKHIDSKGRKKPPSRDATVVFKRQPSSPYRCYFLMLSSA